MSIPGRAWGSSTISCRSTAGTAEHKICTAVPGGRKKRGKSSAGKVPGVSQGGTEWSRSWPRVLAEKKRLNDFLGCMRQCIHCRSGGVILPLCSAPVCWVQGCAPQWERSQKGGLVEVYKYPKGQWSLAVFSGAQCQDNGHKLGHKSFCPSIPKIFFIVQDLRRSLPTIP